MGRDRRAWFAPTARFGGVASFNRDGSGPDGHCFKFNQASQLIAAMQIIGIVTSKNLEVSNLLVVGALPCSGQSKIQNPKYKIESSLNPSDAPTAPRTSASRNLLPNYFRPSGSDSAADFAGPCPAFALSSFTF